MLQTLWTTQTLRSPQVRRNLVTAFMMNIIITWWYGFLFYFGVLGTNQKYMICVYLCLWTFTTRAQWCQRKCCFQCFVNVNSGTKWKCSLPEVWWSVDERTLGDPSSRAQTVSSHQTRDRVLISRQPFPLCPLVLWTTWFNMTSVITVQLRVIHYQQ